MENGLLTVKEFSRLSRTSRDILHHYEKIGLLSPATRGANHYRYYSVSQLAVTNVIQTLQRLGITLKEIQQLHSVRTPQSVDDLFCAQAEKIDQRIQSWVSAKKLLLSLRDTVRSGLDAQEDTFAIQFLPVAAIILGPLNDYSRGRNDYDALTDFYQHFHNRFPNMELNYPVWGLFTQERIMRGDWVWPDRYYFYNPDGHDKRPAALYAIGYTRGGYGQGTALYEAMTAYIEKNGYEICGDAYEEYPLNELSEQNPEDFLIRVLITVREKAKA
jgi:DNA-binding transcriptional MerR regulator